MEDSTIYLLGLFVTCCAYFLLITFVLWIFVFLVRTLVNYNDPVEPREALRLVTKCYIVLIWAILNYLAFIFDEPVIQIRYFNTRLLCDVCKLYEEGSLKFCRECDQYMCTRCYSLHQMNQLIKSQCHQTYTCIGRDLKKIATHLSRQVLEHDKTKLIYQSNDVKCANFFRLDKTVNISVFNDWGIETKSLEDRKPCHSVKFNIPDLSNVTGDSIRTFTFFRPTELFVFHFFDGSHTRFVCAKVPLSEKLKKFPDLLSFDLSKISYNLEVCTSGPYYYFSELSLRKKYVNDDTLFTEIAHMIAFLVDENSPNFGLAPRWSIILINMDVAQLNIRLQSLNEDKELFEKPACMTSTLENTFVICDSRETGGCVIEFDMGGYIVSKVYLKEELSGTIKAVTSDDESNIYVCSEKIVVQMSKPRQRTRELLSLKKSRNYGAACITDICFSLKTRKLYVMMKEGDKGTVVSFKFTV